MLKSGRTTGLWQYQVKSIYYRNSFLIQLMDALQKPDWCIMPTWPNDSKNEWWISYIFKKFIWNLRFWETKWRLTAVAYKCSFTALGILELSVDKEGTYFFHCFANVHMSWDFCIWGQSWNTCWGSETGMGFGGGAHIWFLECYWVLCTSVALTFLISWSLLSELILTSALIIVLRQRTWDPVRGAEAQWQWMAHRPGGAERKKP